MHVAGRCTHLYPFLKKAVKEVPSANYVEEFLRVTALAHDIGHGPFCHFFDDNYLHAFHASHEKLGQIIIRDHLGPIIRKIRRSPSGPFAKGEELNPDQIAHVILKEKGKDNSRIPRWLNMLQPVISGSYTADNLDYVLRDSYMCGVAVGPVDLSRLIHYTIITDKGFTIHKTGFLPYRCSSIPACISIPTSTITGPRAQSTSISATSSASMTPVSYDPRKKMDSTYR
jgi:HD superfamily phosphohydrolase